MKENKSELPAFGRGSYNNQLRRSLWWMLFIALSTAIIIFNFFPRQIYLSAGDVATEDIYFTGNDTSYNSQIRTRQAQEQAASEVDPVYIIDDKPLAGLNSMITSDFVNMAVIASDYGLDSEQRLTAFRRLLGENFSDAVLVPLFLLDNRGFESLRGDFQRLLREAFESGLTEDELYNASVSIRRNISGLEYSLANKEFLLVYFDSLSILPNKFYDSAGTEKAVQQAISNVSPVMISVKKGETIITKGSIVTELQIESLSNLGLLKQSTLVLPIIGIGMLVIMFYILLIMYVRRYYPHTRGREANIVLIGVLFNIMLLLSKLLSQVDVIDPAVSVQIGYMVPVAAMSMLLTILLGQGIAIFITAFMSLCIGIMLQGGLYAAFVALTSGLTGVFCSGNINQRGQFVNSSIYVSLAAICAISAVNFLTKQSYSAIAAGIGFGFVNGILSAVFTMGILPFLESGFKITTSVKLMELANSNHPLLKRLMMEAPGTYHHSVLVGNLAESAADAIGVDSLLVRVAAYYHDIGKIKRPLFFIENQHGEKNPHDTLQPSLSTLIITSHVKDGVEILKEHRFPQEIIDAAQTHHGTSVLNIFYRKAADASGNPAGVRREDYAYAGPLPFSKELALVSLADSVQAAVRALATDDRDLIEQRVRSVVKGRIDEGQLADSPLTFRDIELIIIKFVKVLTGINHGRIEYPDQVKEQIKKSLENADAETDKENGEENDISKDSETESDKEASKEN